MIFLLSILFLIFINSSDIKLLNIVGNNNEVNYYLYLKFILTLYFSFLLLLITKGKYNFINLIWLVPISFLVINYSFSFQFFQKLDYYVLGKKINQFDTKQYEDRGWIINEFIIKNSQKNDTIYFNNNPSWTKKIYNLEEIKQAKITKSIFSGYYFLSIKE